MIGTMQLHTKVLNLGPVARIPLGEGRTVQAGNVVVAVFHMRGGDIFGTQAFCSHRAAPLADGIIGAGRVICPLHGCEFDLATGQSVRVGCRRLKTYPVSVDEAGDILLRLEVPYSKEAHHQVTAGRVSHRPPMAAAT